MKGIKSMPFLCLLALVSLLSACQSSNPQEMQSEGVQTFTGKGVSLQYPANARVESVSTDPAAKGEIRIIGPEVWIKPGDADWSYRGPAYEMIVRTYDNPDRLDAEAWARNHILTSWQQARERGEPIMGPPVSESGEITEQQVGRSTVAGKAAFWANFFAGDSYRRTFFLANKHQVVALSFYDYPLANQPLAMVQQGIYALIMSTFRFENK